MTQTIPLAGSVGTFMDPSTNQLHEARVNGTMTFESMGGAPGDVPRLEAAIMQSAQALVATKLARGEVTLALLPGMFPNYLQEVAQQSGAEGIGFRVTGLRLALETSQTAMPPNPQQAMANAFAHKAEQAMNPDNYVVHARVNVGGIDVDMNSRTGVNEERLMERVKDRAISEVVWIGIGCAVVAAVVIGAIGMGIYIWREASGSSEPGAEEMALWNGLEPYSCGGNDVVRIVGVNATLASGTAITAGGSCQLELVNVTISADTGIQTGANAKVTVTGGSITGRTAAVSALGNSQVVLSGTTIVGPLDHLGNATIVGP